MKAILLKEPFRIEITDRPKPQPAADEILIKVHYCGLCGSDLSAFKGISPMVRYPRIPGHEISASIVECGEKVPQKFQAGMPVTLSPYTSCGICPACRQGRPNTCQFNQTMGVQRDGALSEYACIHHTKIFTSPALSFTELALVEPLCVGYHAANRGEVSETDTVLVFGCGAVGLGAVAAAARKGARVVAVDIDDEKLELAGSLGARFTINSRHNNLEKEVEQITSGEGASVCIEAAGLPATTRSVFDLTAFAGRVVLIGYSKEEVSLASRLIVSKELNVAGSRNALHEFPAVIEMLEQRQFPFEKMISRMVSLEETPQVFKEWADAPQKFTKIIVNME